MIVIEELGGGVWWAPAESIQVVLVASGLCGKSKIAQLHMFLGNHKNIFCFDIAMNESQKMLTKNSSIDSRTVIK